jgi:hypothetical protein
MRLQNILAAIFKKIFLIQIIFFSISCNFLILNKTKPSEVFKNKFSNIVWESTINKNDYLIFDEIDTTFGITCFIVHFHEDTIKNTIKIWHNSFSFVMDKHRMKLCDNGTKICQDISLNKSILTFTYKSDDGDIVVKNYNQSNRNFPEVQKRSNIYSR